MTDLHPFPVLDESILDPDPIRQFKAWYADAVEAKILHADCMVLATATPDGKPSARVVLLKSADESGFVFYTSYNSPKARDLEANPQTALTFFWGDINREVRIGGIASRLSAAESDIYIASRPRESQLSSLASSQSEPIGSRAELDRRFGELQKLYEGKTIPRPAHWGGYRVKPEIVEFWQSRFARLNDRVVYRRGRDGSWTKTRLQP